MVHLMFCFKIKLKKYGNHCLNIVLSICPFVTQLETDARSVLHISHLNIVVKFAQSLIRSLTMRAKERK